MWISCSTSKIASCYPQTTMAGDDWGNYSTHQLRLCSHVCSFLIRQTLARLGFFNSHLRMCFAPQRRAMSSALPLTSLPYSTIPEHKAMKNSISRDSYLSCTSMALLTSLLLTKMFFSWYPTAIPPLRGSKDACLEVVSSGALQKWLV